MDDKNWANLYQLKGSKIAVIKKGQQKELFS